MARAVLHDRVARAQVPPWAPSSSSSQTSPRQRTHSRSCRYGASRGRPSRELRAFQGASPPPPRARPHVQVGRCDHRRRRDRKQPESEAADRREVRVPRPGRARVGERGGAGLAVPQPMELPRGRHGHGDPVERACRSRTRPCLPACGRSRPCALASRPPGGRWWPAGWAHRQAETQLWLAEGPRARVQRSSHRPPYASLGVWIEWGGLSDDSPWISKDRAAPVAEARIPQRRVGRLRVESAVPSHPRVGGGTIVLHCGSHTCPFSPGRGSGRTRSWRRSAPAGWERSGGRATRGSTATSRSRSSPPASREDESSARFEREAKTISSLNHPNICTLLRRRPRGRRALPRHGADRRRVARGPPAEGPLPIDQVLRVRRADRGRARRGARAGDRPSRPQARQRHADEDRREAARLRPRAHRRDVRPSSA